MQRMEGTCASCCCSLGLQQPGNDSKQIVRIKGLLLICRAMLRKQVLATDQSASMHTGGAGCCCCLCSCHAQGIMPRHRMASNPGLTMCAACAPAAQRLRHPKSGPKAAVDSQGTAPQAAPPLGPAATSLRRKFGMHTHASLLRAATCQANGWHTRSYLIKGTDWAHGNSHDPGSIIYYQPAA